MHLTMQWTKIRKCPVCGRDSPVYGGQYVSIKHHITNLAKNEAYFKALNLIKETKHLDFVKKHSRVLKIKQFQFIIKI